MAGCSIHTVRAIEIGKLRLSKSLAERLSMATGASAEWLLEGNPLAPMVDAAGELYGPESLINHLMTEGAKEGPKGKALMKLENQQYGVLLEWLLNEAMKSDKKWNAAKLFVRDMLDSCANLIELKGKRSPSREAVRKLCREFSARYEKNRRTADALITPDGAKFAKEMISYLPKLGGGSIKSKVFRNMVKRQRAEADLPKNKTSS
jgi:hypothetical protein